MYIVTCILQKDSLYYRGILILILIVYHLSMNTCANRERLHFLKTVADTRHIAYIGTLNNVGHAYIHDLVFTEYSGFIYYVFYGNLSEFLFTYIYI